MSAPESSKTTSRSKESLDVLMRLKGDGIHMQDKYLEQLALAPAQLSDMEKKALHEHIGYCPRCKEVYDTAWRELVAEDFQKAS